MTVELLVTNPAGQSHTQILQVGQRLVLGRGQKADLRLQDLEASRQHVAVEVTQRGVLVTDLGSGNGTVLAGERLPPNQPRGVSLPAQFEVGTHTVFLRLPGSGSPAPAVERRMRDEYEHVATLGSGAHGTVSAAVHRATGNEVAIKTFRADAVSPSIRARFLREGRIRIDCPFIAQVYDVREEGSNLFIVMELVRGRSAQDLLADGPLAIPLALRIAADVALGLQVAHKHGVVHRDIKPTNIIVTAEGRAKIVDFGIAKMKGETLTNTGQGIGTLSYLAPEQASDAKRVDPMADLYSLGATLYHFLAGKPPFDSKAPDFIDKLYDLDPPKLTKLRPDCPKKVARLVHQLLEKEPEDRATNTKTVARQLERLLKALATQD